MIQNCFWRFLKFCDMQNSWGVHNAFRVEVDLEVQFMLSCLSPVTIIINFGMFLTNIVNKIFPA